MSPMPAIDPAAVPSSLDLLDIPYAFTQRRLLTHRSFVDEARKRGYNLDADMLEWLHRRSVLVPLFRIYSRPVEPVLDEDSRDNGSMNLAYLYQAANEGRVRDPALTRFRPWPSNHIDRGVRYSWFQLLSLRHIVSPITQLQSSAYRIDDCVNDGFRVGYDLPQVSSKIKSTATRNRALAIVLEVLSPRYTPRVLDRLVFDPGHDRVEMTAYLRERSRVEQKLLSDVLPTVLRNQAHHWLGVVRHFDPLGEWWKVIRLSNWRQWEYLKLAALDAMELRIAAEMFLYYCDDLIEADKVEQVRDRHQSYPQLYDGRLKVSYPERAKTLQRFRLVSAPAVVVVVEGHTEMKIIPRVLELFDAGPDTGLVTFINLKGIDADIKLVARSVAVPALLPEGQGRATLLRPLVGLVVAVDQEGRYNSPERIKAQRSAVLDEILQSVPTSLATGTLRSQLEQAVIVTTWGDQGCFEYAHFSDSELAQAILDVANEVPSMIKTQVPPYNDLIVQVASHRSAGNDIKHAWMPWVSISKLQLADVLWPVLRCKLTSDNRGVLPVTDLADRIIDLAINLAPVTMMKT